MACNDRGLNFLLAANLAKKTASNAVISLETLTLGLGKLSLACKEYLVVHYT